MKKRLKLFLLLILVVSIAFGESSCTQNVTSGANSKYKTYALKHYGVSFSFEYPVGYKTILSYIQDNPDASIVSIQAGGELTRFFGVDIYSPNARAGRPCHCCKHGGLAYPDEELKEHQSRLLELRAKWLHYNSDDYQNAPSINRGVYFDVNGVLWSISIYSSTANADRAENDFDHIISTFKVN